MMPVTRIVFCRCSGAEILPPAGKAAVLGALQAAEVPVHYVDDLCVMASQGSAQLGEWAREGGTRIVACHPRAVAWLFHHAGATLDPSRTEVVDLRELETEAIPQAVAQPQVHPNCPSTVDAAPRFQSLKPATGWFPIIDFGLCTHCMQCLGFCLFGVFGVDAQRHLEVQHPELCKPGCPACSRVCPEMAIIFPKHASNAINGGAAVQAPRQPTAKVDISALLGGDVYSTLRKRSANARERFSAERDPEQARQERQRHLADLVASGDIPPEVLAALPSMPELQARAQEAAARVRAAREGGV